MFKQIRSLLSEDLQLEGSSVEMDETYFGGRRPRREHQVYDNKTPIVGIVERKGRVVAKATPNVTGATLLGMARERILPDSTVYTDEARGYDGLKNVRRADGSNAGYQYRRVHQQQQNLRGWRRAYEQH